MMVAFGFLWGCGDQYTQSGGMTKNFYTTINQSGTDNTIDTPLVVAAETAQETAAGDTSPEQTVSPEVDTALSAKPTATARTRSGNRNW